MRIKSKLVHYIKKGDHVPRLDVGEYLVVNNDDVYCNVFVINSSFAGTLIDVIDNLDEFCKIYDVEKDND